MTATAPVRKAPDLSFFLNQTSHALTNRLAAALAAIGTTPRAHCVLSKALTGEFTQIQLAESTNLDKTTMVVTLDELERDGYAERRPSATDRRARIVVVTEAGARLSAKAQEIVDRVHGDVLSALPESERAAFVRALSLLAADHLASPSHMERPIRRPRAR